MKCRKYKTIPESLSYLWKFPISTYKYTRLLKKYSPDVSISFLDIDNLINIIACRYVGVKAVTSMRESPTYAKTRLIVRIIRHIVFSFCGNWTEMVIPNSEGSKNALVKMYDLLPDKISVVYNPKDIDLITQMSFEPVTEEFFNTDDPILIAIGSLSLKKGIWHLFRIFASIHHSYPCKLILCGKGELREELEALAVEYGIAEDVLFLGWSDNPYKYIRNSTIFIFPQISAGLPNVLIEALICGCPVVSTDCEFGPREILDYGKYGYLCETLNGVHYDANHPLTSAEIDMETKIISLISDEHLREKFSKMGIERGKMFEKNEKIQEYANIISDVCNI